MAQGGNASNANTVRANTFHITIGTGNTGKMMVYWYWRWCWYWYWCWSQNWYWCWLALVLVLILVLDMLVVLLLAQRHWWVQAVAGQERARIPSGSMVRFTKIKRVLSMIWVSVSPKLNAWFNVFRPRRAEPCLQFGASAQKTRLTCRAFARNKKRPHIVMWSFSLKILNVKLMFLYYFNASRTLFCIILTGTTGHQNVF